eukprot:TRINITY_DN29410_c0_g1_i1.p1 TRINITY_DN29410_c0_g1~~TRINITY_DN29410_c0_g1_i1.p1  ORF type:complete len:787 (-),score=101.19 TRINITY_DN29410_c0_g1_i1:195-2555(-)
MEDRSSLKVPIARLRLLLRHLALSGAVASSGASVHSANEDFWYHHAGSKTSHRDYLRKLGQNQAKGSVALDEFESFGNDSDFESVRALLPDLRKDMDESYRLVAVDSIIRHGTRRPKSSKANKWSAVAQRTLGLRSGYLIEGMVMPLSLFEDGSKATANNVEALKESLDPDISNNLSLLSSASGAAGLAFHDPRKSEILTTEGWRELRALGRVWSTVLSSVDSPWVMQRPLRLEKDIVFETSSKPRCVASGRAFLAGFFGESEEEGEEVLTLQEQMSVPKSLPVEIQRQSRGGPVASEEALRSMLEGSKRGIKLVLNDERMRFFQSETEDSETEIDPLQVASPRLLHENTISDTSFESASSSLRRSISLTSDSLLESTTNMSSDNDFGLDRVAHGADAKNSKNKGKKKKGAKLIGKERAQEFENDVVFKSPLLKDLAARLELAWRLESGKGLPEFGVDSESEALLSQWTPSAISDLWSLAMAQRADKVGLTGERLREQSSRGFGKSFGNLLFKERESFLVLEALEDLKHHFKNGWGNIQATAAFAESAVLGEWASLAHPRQEKSESPFVRFSFGHAETILPVLTWLGLAKDELLARQASGLVDKKDDVDRSVDAYSRALLDPVAFEKELGFSPDILQSPSLLHDLLERDRKWKVSQLCPFGCHLTMLLWRSPKKHDRVQLLLNGRQVWPRVSAVAPRQTSAEPGDTRSRKDSEPCADSGKKAMFMKPTETDSINLQSGEDLSESDGSADNFVRFLNERIHWLRGMTLSRETSKPKDVSQTAGRTEM